LTTLPSARTSSKLSPVPTARNGRTHRGSKCQALALHPCQQQTLYVPSSDVTRRRKRISRADTLIHASGLLLTPEDSCARVLLLDVRRLARLWCRLLRMFGAEPRLRRDPRAMISSFHDSGVEHSNVAFRMSNRVTSSIFSRLCFVIPARLQKRAMRLQVRVYARLQRCAEHAVGISENHYALHESHTSKFVDSILILQRF
jgi:hypothetical protein